MKDTLVTIYLNGGHVISGIVDEFTEEHVIIITTDKSRVVIPNITNVIAIKYSINQKKETVKAKVEEDTISHKPGDINSLTELRKIKSQEDIKSIREHILKQTPTSNPVPCPPLNKYELPFL